MLSKMKKLFVVLCASALTFLSLGIVTLLPARAENSLTTAEALEEFAMQDGAAIRKSTDKQGIRFNALLSKQAYAALENAGAEFGMLIVPKDYVTAGYELTVENVFGESAVYVPNVKASELAETDPTKKAIIQIKNPTTTESSDIVKIYGSIVGVLDSNIDRGFIGRAYVCLDGVYYLADYADDLVDNNTRSMAYVAQCAIEDGDEDSDTLQTNYIDKVQDKYYDYTINEVTIDFDGSITKTVLETGNAKFGEVIEYESVLRLGFENSSVESFVAMQNAEFNVLYTATPVNVVVDADASATELYAANELAGYIEEVTGKAVYVGVQTSTINNIYISTDPSLGLAMDSFKLSTDANGNIRINGVDDRGTLYGVYEYEEKNLGIKFLSETYTYVPVTNKQIATLTLAQEKTYVPAFAYRTYMNNGVGMDGDENVKYSSHLRFVSQFSQEKVPTELMHQVQYFMPWMAKPWLTASHSLVTYAAIGAYQLGRTDLVSATFDENGFFTSCKFTDAAISGEAEGAIDNGAGIPDVCYSSDTAKQWVIAGLKYMIDTYGESYDYFMLGQADKTTECDCSACKKAIVSSISNWWNPPDNKADLVARFIRDVVTEVNKNGEKYASEKIVMFAYQKTEAAPKNAITDMPDNVYIQWAPIDQDRYFALDATNPTNWKTQIGMDEGRFLIWSYETDFGYYFNYYPTMHTWIDNFQTYKDLGVEAVMMQSTWNTKGVADSYLDAYVASKLLWNFEVNNESEMEALRDAAKEEFIQYFYGDAAKDLILQYYNNFDALYETKFSSKGYLNSGARSFKESDLNALLALINEAIAKTSDETHLAHLNMLSFTPRYMLCQYCSVTDDALLTDMNAAGVSRSREGTEIEDDSFLSGFLMFKKGGTEIKTIEYDANGRISHLTLEVPDNCEWTSCTPSFTAEFMQDLYKNGVRTLSMYSNSTATTGNVIYTYNETANYGCAAIENIALTADGSEFRFNYVDVGGNVHGPGGLTIGTTLDLYFNYYAEGAAPQNEIGMTLAQDVRFFKNPINGEYVVSNTSGADGSAYFSAEQVNTWISQGYKTLSLTAEFEAAANIDQMVGFDTAYKTDKSGHSEWTFNLTQDTPIKLWAQQGGVGSSGKFTLSNVELRDVEKPYHTNYSKLVSDSYDENGRLTQLVVEVPAGVEWWVTPPQIMASYLNGLYADGVYQVVIDATSTTTTNNFFTQYGSSTTDSLNVTVLLTANGPDLQFAYVNLSGGGVTVATTLTLDFTYIEEEPQDPAEVAAEIGATLNGETTIHRNLDGSYTVSDAHGDQNGLEFSATQVNEWISQGYETLSMTVSFTPEDGVINKTVGWTNSMSWITDETGSANWTFNLKQDEKICLWTQFGDNLYKASFTISNLKLNQDPAKVAAEIGATLKGVTTISKNTDGSYEVYDTRGMDGGLEFTAEQVNEWLDQGYSSISLSLSFTAVANVIDEVVVYGQSSTMNSIGYIEDYSGAIDLTLLLNRDQTIYIWTQANHGGQPNSTFTISNFKLNESPEKIAAEIGMTLANGSNIIRDGNGGYVLSNVGATCGGMMSAYFSAEQVNEWISQGYSVLKLKVKYEITSTIDQVVAVHGETFDGAQWFQTTEGSAEWTFNLTADKPLQFWAQKSGGANSGAFTLYDIELKYFENYYTQGYATITDAQVENDILLGLTAAFVDQTSGWEVDAPRLTAEYLNYLYKLGVRVIKINVTGNAHHLLTRYNGGVDWNGTPIQLVENGGALEFSHLDVSAGNGLPTASTVNLTFEYGYSIDKQTDFGAKANGTTVIFKNIDGSYQIFDARGMESGLEFTAEQVNEWLDQGYSSISLSLSFTAVANVIDEVVVYGQSSTMNAIGYIEDYSGAIDLTLVLNRDQAIYIWTQVNHSPQPNSTFTLSNFMLNHYSFNCGYSTIINETIDENGRLTSLTVSIPEGTNWWENPPTISGTYLNNLYADGIRQVVIDATSTTTTNNFFTLYGSSTTETLNATVLLTDNGPDLQFSYVNLSGGGVTVGTTLTLTFSYSA